jgi:hypothetical protein
VAHEEAKDDVAELDACGRAAGSYGEGMRLGLTLGAIGAAIGLGGLVYGCYWVWTHLGA